jgi:hypothetical protein
MQELAYGLAIDPHSATVRHIRVKQVLFGNNFVEALKAATINKGAG